jgi:hypothetical protein
MAIRKTPDDLGRETARKLCGEMRKHVRTDHGGRMKRDGIRKFIQARIADSDIISIVAAWGEGQRLGILERLEPRLAEIELRNPGPRS